MQLVQKPTFYCLAYALQTWLVGTLAVCSVLTSSNSFAAEFRPDKSIGYGISISGEIKDGDYDQFIALFSELTAVKEGRLIFPYYLSISSPGGNLQEALRLASSCPGKGIIAERAELGSGRIPAAER